MPGRILYISSSIGLGHATRDLAIADELRRADPKIEILWLAAHPASDCLRQAEERLVPESEHWASATDVAEKTAEAGELNIVRYVSRSIPAWTHNARVASRAVRAHHADLIVGDEAYEVVIAMLVGLVRLPVPLVMINDLMGIDAVTQDPIERLEAWGTNFLWSRDHRIFDSTPNEALFIGEPADVPARPLGWHLPDRRAYAAAHYTFVGHVIGFRPDDLSDRNAVRKRLGYGKGPLVVCSVGGTAVGKSLLELCGRAYKRLRDAHPDLRMVAVCGPRVPVEAVHVPSEVEIRGYVPKLYEHFAASDVAVVQCGGTTTTELAALERPFIYFPLEGHTEQALTAERLARWGVGERMSLETTTAQQLADAIESKLGQRAPCPEARLNGAPRAAAEILAALARHRTERQGCDSGPLR